MTTPSTPQIQTGNERVLLDKLQAIAQQADAAWKVGGEHHMSVTLQDIAQQLCDLFTISSDDRERAIDALIQKWSTREYGQRAGYLSAPETVDIVLAALSQTVQAPDELPVERNNPVSALAIRILVDRGIVTQEQANEAFHTACYWLQEEAARQNLTLPWVVAPFLASTPLTCRMCGVPGCSATCQFQDYAPSVDLVTLAVTALEEIAQLTSTPYRARKIAEDAIAALTKDSLTNKLPRSSAPGLPSEAAAKVVAWLNTIALTPPTALYWTNGMFARDCHDAAKVVADLNVPPCTSDNTGDKT